VHADAYLASRIIRLELVDTESVLRVATERSPFHWPPTAGYQLPIAAWSAYAGKFAVYAAPEVWDQVAAVYSTFNYTNLLTNLNHETARALLTETETATAALTAAVATLESEDRPIRRRCSPCAVRTKAAAEQDASVHF
jgi:hypothetical protein